VDVGFQVCHGLFFKLAKRAFHHRLDADLRLHRRLALILSRVLIFLLVKTLMLLEQLQAVDRVAANVANVLPVWRGAVERQMMIQRDSRRRLEGTLGTAELSARLDDGGG